MNTYHSTVHGTACSSGGDSYGTTIFDQRYGTSSKDGYDRLAYRNDRLNDGRFNDSKNNLNLNRGTTVSGEEMYADRVEYSGRSDGVPGRKRSRDLQSHSIADDQGCSSSYGDVLQINLNGRSQQYVDNDRLINNVGTGQYARRVYNNDTDVDRQTGPVSVSRT